VGSETIVQTLAAHSFKASVWRSIRPSKRSEGGREMPTLEEFGGHEADKPEKVMMGGSVVELLAGVAAIVLPILGLIGVLPMSLGAIAFIAIGGAMMMRGGAVGSQSRLLLGHIEATAASAEVVGGMSAEVLGGAAVSALGILALLRIAPITLLAVACIVAGGAIVVSAGTTSRLSTFRLGASRLDETRREILHHSVEAAAGADVLVGLATIVLGILVLAHVGTAAVHLTLVLVAALALGGALFLNGTTVGARMSALLRH
jgi:hypothetical protein